MRRFFSWDTARTFRKRESGNVATMTAIALMVIVGAVAMTVDVSKGINTKTRLADASDALSIALAKSRIEGQAEMHQFAMTFLTENYPSPKDEQLDILSITRDEGAVTVVLSDVSDNGFGSFFGDDKMDVSVTSTAVFKRKVMDIALVLDSTGSMRGSKMANLKQSATDMVDIVDEYADTNVRMSVVPFAQHVNVGPSERNAAWAQVLPNNRGRNSRSHRIFEGCIGSRSVPNNLRVAYNGRQFPAVYQHDNINCGSPVLPLTTNFTTVKTRVNSMVARGATYMPAGLMWGWRMLDDREPFAHASAPGTEKVLILMTDGENTVSKNGIRHSAHGSRSTDKDTATICGAIKNDNITVYTIAYEVNSHQTRNLLQNCASSNENYFDARNAADLRSAFKNIANKLTDIRISA